MTIQDECDVVKDAFRRVTGLLERYPGTLSSHDKALQLRQDQSVTEAFYSYPVLDQYLKNVSDEEYTVFATVALLQQLDHVFCGSTSLDDPQQVFQKLAPFLVQCERFYAPIGGLLGYYKETVQRIIAKRSNDESGVEADIEFREVPWYDLRNGDADTKFSESGLQALRATAEIYTVGGAGERLGLVEEETNDPLPVAYLSFLGRPLLEHLFRDLLAREYLYEKTFGSPITVPVVLMTSSELHNDRKIDGLLKRYHYFDRPIESIHKIVQFLVPLVDLDGNFVLHKPCQLILKPGGHGVLWRLLYVQGAFDWLEKQHVKHLVVRQINNPLAGLDGALLQLVGVAEENNKRFGFASMPRQPGLTEGLNVLCIKDGKEASITNLEYTSFEAVLKKDPNFFTRSSFAANANILYANLQEIKELATRVLAPGLLINMKGKQRVYERGEYVEKVGVRLESTMQNIADDIRDPIEKGAPISKEQLSTFLNLHDREKIFSVTKRPLLSPKEARETPEYCLYDWYRMTFFLLKEVNEVELPEEQTFEQFFEKGPNLLFTFHPGFGPLWSIIQDRMSHLVLKEGAELEIEMAEAQLHSVSVHGSLLIRSLVPCGRKGNSLSVPRVSFQNVAITNKGLCRPAILKNILEKTAVREEVCECVLEEGSELVAENVEIVGPFSIQVPKYTRATLRMDPVSKSILIQKKSL